METKLYTKADVNARKEAQSDGVASEDAMSEAITKGLGERKIFRMWTAVRQDCAVLFMMQRESAMVF